ncbi:hypothetical protein ABZ569_00715 [Streptomyces albus]|uniref:hypothetical protein n=1 Tax=Streptomyces albus TaxID=1888 RepID=UPI0033D45C03
MLSTPVRQQQGTGRCARAAFACEAYALTFQGLTHSLGTHRAASPRLALRWVHARTEDIADQLEPPTGWQARAWMRDEAERERALAGLANGRPYTVELVEDGTRYVLTARPTL